MIRPYSLAAFLLGGYNYDRKRIVRKICRKINV